MQIILQFKLFFIASLFGLLFILFKEFPTYANCERLNKHLIIP